MVLGRSFGRGHVIAAFLILGVLSAPPARLLAEDASDAPAAKSAEGGEVEKVLTDGLTLFREGKYAESVVAFEKAFALDPGQDQIARFLDATSLSYFMQMVRSDDARISGIGTRLLLERQKRVRTMISDPEGIKALVDKVFMTKEDQERMLLMLEGANKYGRNLVPFLVAKLGDNETSARTLAILWIPKIGIDALPPLHAAVRHPDAAVRANVARLLGTRTLRHAFSLAPLAALVETEKDPEVKSAAATSLRTILGDAGYEKPLAAKEYYFRLAERLYKNLASNPFAQPVYQAVVYSLKDKDVVGEVVAPFQLSPRMAEQNLVEALRLDPSFFKAKVLLLANEAGQVVDYDASMGFYATPEGEKDAEGKAILDGQKENFEWVRKNRIKAYAPEVIFAALHRSIEDRRPDVSEKLIDVIRENRIRGAVPPALVEALTAGSSRLVRIAAAVALAEWNPEETGEFGDAVVGILAEAAVNSGVRTVHKVMGNEANANRFDEVFRDLNIESGTNFTSVSTALPRTIGTPPDLILLDEDVTPVPSLKGVGPVNAFINEIRKSYRTQGTPIVVALDPAKLEDHKKLYENEERKVWVIPSDADKTAVKNQVIDRVFAASDDQKARSTKLAARAAEALARLAGGNTRFPIASSREALQKTLQNRPDEVRIPALTALGNMGPAAAPALAQIAGVFANAESDTKVREAAMVAVAHILNGAKGPASQDVLNAIRTGMMDGDAKLRQASFMAFAVSGASSEEGLRQLFDQAHAPEKGAAAAPGKAGAKAAGEKAEGGDDAKPADAAAPEAKEGDAKDAGAGDKDAPAAPPEK